MDSDHDGISNLTECALDLDDLDPPVSDGSPGMLSGGMIVFNKRSLAVGNGDVTYPTRRHLILLDLLSASILFIRGSISVFWLMYLPWPTRWEKDVVPFMLQDAVGVSMLDADVGNLH